MKNKILFLLTASALLVFKVSTTKAQNADNRWSWNTFVDFNTVQDRIGKEGWNLNKSNLGVQTGASYYINPSFNASGYIGAGQLEYKDLLDFQFADFNVLGEYKFNNGYLLEEDFWLKPYLTAGVGYVVQDRSGFFDLPVGAGVKFALAEDVDLNLQTIYNSISDEAGVDFIQTKVGVNFAIGGNSRSKDSDKDGIADDMDSCPNEKGLAEYNGCPPPPDQDNDGIADAVDACPALAGLKDFNGCPDSDADGIPDNLDECPNKKGTKTYKGCPVPDSDQDGVPDDQDNCPNQAGSVNGCPDTDGDGIIDKEDSCPKESGVASNNGCPELKEEEKEVLKEALEGVHFLSGKDVLTDDSKPKLDKVAEVLLAHPGYKIKVSGYTDSSGDESANLALSKSRATAVKDYLISDGVASERITADGFGEADPVADNSTREGRAKNRRVEFEIVFE